MYKFVVVHAFGANVTLCPGQRLCTCLLCSSCCLTVNVLSSSCRVDVTAKARTKKLRNEVEEDVMDGQTYTERLRRQYVVLLDVLQRLLSLPADSQFLVEQMSLYAVDHCLDITVQCGSDGIIALLYIMLAIPCTSSV